MLCHGYLSMEMFEQAKAKKPADLDRLLKGNEVWVIN
jgi:hypothetical protein